MKYLRPTSVTWLASMVPVCLGVFQATLPLHGLELSAQIISNMTGGASPYVLINAGLVGIGMRGAMG